MTDPSETTTPTQDPAPEAMAAPEATSEVHKATPGTLAALKAVAEASGAEVVVVAAKEPKLDDAEVKAFLEQLQIEQARKNAEDLVVKCGSVGRARRFRQAIGRRIRRAAARATRRASKSEFLIFSSQQAEDLARGRREARAERKRLREYERLGEAPPVEDDLKVIAARVMEKLEAAGVDLTGVGQE